jgi:hypothetical protein
MKTDVYTKGMLTVIAACLVWICANGGIPVTHAQAKAPEPMPVILVDARGNPLYGLDGLRVNLGVKTMPVVVANLPLPVDVSKPIQVQVLREPPTQRPIP